MRFFEVLPDHDEESPAGLVDRIIEPPGLQWHTVRIELGRAQYEGRQVCQWTLAAAALRRGDFAAYQPSFAGRWFSPAVAEVLDTAFASSSVATQWFDADLYSHDLAEKRPYRILHFPQRFRAVAEPTASTSGPGGLIKVVLESSRVEGLLAFPSPRPVSDIFYVAEPVMEQLLEAGVPLRCFFLAPTT